MVTRGFARQRNLTAGEYVRPRLGEGASHIACPLTGILSVGVFSGQLFPSPPVLFRPFQGDPVCKVIVRGDRFDAEFFKISFSHFMIVCHGLYLVSSHPVLGPGCIHCLPVSPNILDSMIIEMHNEEKGFRVDRNQSKIVGSSPEVVETS